MMLPTWDSFESQSASESHELLAHNRSDASADLSIYGQLPQALGASLLSSSASVDQPSLEAFVGENSYYPAGEDWSTRARQALHSESSAPASAAHSTALHKRRQRTQHSQSHECQQQDQGDNDARNAIYTDACHAQCYKEHICNDSHDHKLPSSASIQEAEQRDHCDTADAPEDEHDQCEDCEHSQKCDIHQQSKATTTAHGRIPNMEPVDESTNASVHTNGNVQAPVPANNAMCTEFPASFNHGNSAADLSATNTTDTDRHSGNSEYIATAHADRSADVHQRSDAVVNAKQSIAAAELHSPPSVSGCGSRHPPILRTPVDTTASADPLSNPQQHPSADCREQLGHGAKNASKSQQVDKSPLHDQKYGSEEVFWRQQAQRLQMLASVTSFAAPITQQNENRMNSGKVVSLSADDLVRLVRAASSSSASTNSQSNVHHDDQDQNLQQQKHVVSHSPSRVAYKTNAAAGVVVDLGQPAATHKITPIESGTHLHRVSEPKSSQHCMSPCNVPVMGTNASAYNTLATSEPTMLRARQLQVGSSASPQPSPVAIATTCDVSNDSHHNSSNERSCDRDACSEYDDNSAQMQDCVPFVRALVDHIAIVARNMEQTANGAADSQTHARSSKSDPFSALKHALGDAESIDRCHSKNSDQNEATQVVDNVAVSLPSPPCGEVGAALQDLQAAIQHLVTKCNSHVRSIMANFTIELESSKQAAATALKEQAHKDRAAVAALRRTAADNLSVVQKQHKDEIQAAQKSIRAAEQREQEQVSLLNARVQELQEKLEKMVNDQQHEIDFALYKQRKELAEKAENDAYAELTLRKKHEEELREAHEGRAEELARLRAELQAQVDLWETRARAGEERAVSVQAHMSSEHTALLQRLQMEHDESIQAERRRTAELHADHESELAKVRLQHQEEIEQLQQRQLRISQIDREQLEQRIVAAHTNELQHHKERHAAELEHSREELQRCYREIEKLNAALLAKQAFVRLGRPQTPPPSQHRPMPSQQNQLQQLQQHQKLQHRQRARGSGRASPAALALRDRTNTTISLDNDARKKQNKNSNHQSHLEHGANEHSALQELDAYIECGDVSVA